jgi:hypothetical protein
VGASVGVGLGMGVAIGVSVGLGLGVLVGLGVAGGMRAGVETCRGVESSGSEPQAVDRIRADRRGNMTHRNAGRDGCMREPPCGDRIGLPPQ